MLLILVLLSRYVTLQSVYVVQMGKLILIVYVIENYYQLTYNEMYIMIENNRQVHNSNKKVCRCNLAGGKVQRI